MSNEKKRVPDIIPSSAVSRRTVLLGAGALSTATLVGGLGKSIAQQPVPKTPTRTGHSVQFSVDASQMKVDGGNVIIKDPGLATTMARYGSEGVRKELGENRAKVKIAVSEITIDAQGQVVISNPAFAKAIDSFLSETKSAAAGDTNWCCKCNAYQCSPK